MQQRHDQCEKSERACLVGCAEGRGDIGEQCRDAQGDLCSAVAQEQQQQVR